VEPVGSDVGLDSETVDGIDGTAELRPARALAAVLVAGGALLMGALPAALALGVARLQLEHVAAGVGVLAAVLGGVKLGVAAFAVAGGWWSEHTARLVAAPAG
jgi:hypothetical protein